MKKLLFFSLTVFLYLSLPQVSAQTSIHRNPDTIQHPNLVPNPSFESHTGCPDNQDQLYMADHWFNACWFNPDYFNICSPIGFGVPYNFIGCYQPAHSGNAYAGLSIVVPSVREYLGVRLTEPLKKDYYYGMGFYINCANYPNIATDQFGALVSIDSVHRPISKVILDLYVPQITSPFGQVIDDTIKWLLVSGIFKASGGEEFLTIGNFVDDNALNIIYYNTGYPAGYYYIDDVFVNEVDLGIGIQDDPSRIITLELFPNPAKGNINITIPEAFNMQQLNVNVLNYLGQVILSEKVPANQQKWELSTGKLPDGLYLLKLSHNTEVVGEGKFVVQH